MKRFNIEFKISIALVLIVVMLACCTQDYFIDAKAKPKLNKKSVSMYVGTTTKLKMKNTKKKVKWTSKKKSVATVSKKGVVTAKKAGKAIIIAKLGKKRYECKVTVKNYPVQPIPPLNISLKTELPYTGREIIGSTRYVYEITKADIKYVYYRSTNDYLVGIYLDGVRKSSGDSKLAIGWKLLNSSGSVIDDGYAVSPTVAYGEKFTDAFSVISTNLAPGTYYVELYNYRW